MVFTSPLSGPTLPPLFHLSLTHSSDVNLSVSSCRLWPLSTHIMTRIFGFIVRAILWTPRSLARFLPLLTVNSKNLVCSTVNTLWNDWTETSQRIRLDQCMTTLSASPKSLSSSFIIFMYLHFHRSFSQLRWVYILSLLCRVCINKDKESVTGSNWNKRSSAPFKWFYNYLKVRLVSERGLKNKATQLHELEI